MLLCKFKKKNFLKPGHLRNPIVQDAHRMGILEQWKLDKKVVWQSCIFWTNAANWSSSQVFTWPYSPAFLCHLSSFATLTWPSWSLCPASEDFYGSDMSLCNWPFALEPTPSFYSIHFINWWAKCLFSFSQDCSLLSGSLGLEALLIGVHCKKCYINV